VAVRDVRQALDVAFAAADAARAAIMARWEQGFNVELKADASPVTEADREAEQAIRRVILEAFPKHRVSGEELGDSGEGDMSWLVDPIDGTISFVHHVPLFATLIALCQSGQPVLAVVDLPGLGRRLHAVSGDGAWEGGRRLHVSEEFDPRRSLVCHGNRFDFESAGRMSLYQRLDREVRLFRSYTDAYGHCLVACGAAALMVDPDLQPWDMAAPSLLVREAGGAVYTAPERTGRAGATFVMSGVPAAVAWAEGLLTTPEITSQAH
jgi:histidinol-phosphatase